MYKINVDAEKFASSIKESWALLNSGDEKKAEGKKLLQDVFKDTLKQAFDVEKEISYTEYRHPAFNEIIKSTNELMRVAMFAYTDVYSEKNGRELFNQTAFGGLEAKDMADLAAEDSKLWAMDQKSDEAWELQSKEAKVIADKWLKDPKPYEKMISEMNALAEANKNGTLNRREMVYKLAAAEWLLINNEKMMIEDPKDPLNPIPNWGNRYWRAITQTREALGIDKYLSMRDAIQAGYASVAKSVRSAAYNKTRIEEKLLSKEARKQSDSMDKQREQFATQSAAVNIIEPQKEKKIDDFVMTSDRMQFVVESENERAKMKKEEKIYNFIIDNKQELSLNAPKHDAAK